MNQVLVRRVEATQAIVDAWKGRPFKWGKYDCARLAAAMLRELGWKISVASFGNYKSATTAALALRHKGFADLAGVMDSLGPLRVPQAAALPGDIVGFGHPDQPLGVGLAVAVGNGRVLAFMDNGDGLGPACHVVPPVMTADGADYIAWRTGPL